MNGVAMTLQEAKSIARHLGLTLRQLHSGNYRVNFRDGNETTAYYTDDLENAVNAVVAMARKRAFSGDCRADRIRGGLTAFRPPGRRTVNTEALPGSLFSVTSPPIMRASLRVMARPRPVPPKR